MDDDSRQARAKKRPVLWILTSHWVGMIGVALVTLAGFCWLVAIPLSISGKAPNPYIGLLVFLAIPAVFFAGLAMIPIGVYLGRRRVETGFRGVGDRGKMWMRVAVFFGVMTVVNIAIGSQLTYSAVSHMDSGQFCGETCHTVMQPEFTSYKQSPHSRVECVACHIGPGASWFVKSKLSGMGQVIAVALHDYPTPIPSPVTSLRPARETCEQCHWPQRFAGDKVFVDNDYAEDEQNSLTTTVLLVKVGGRAWNGSIGIHGAHLAENTTIEYIATDAKRQTISRVIYTDAKGKQSVFDSTDPKATPAQLAAGTRRTMDCVDCHNRPTHQFRLPGHALNADLATGDISPALPWIKKQAMEALQKNYPDRQTAQREIRVSLDSFYRERYPQVYGKERVRIDTAIAAVQDVYMRNVFPEMRVTWGTYWNDLGHMDAPGCFRCHDGSHKSADGRTIPNDCDTCHELKAVGEKNPPILDELGIGPTQSAGR